MKGKWLQVAGTELYLPFEVDGQLVLVERNMDNGISLQEFLALYQSIVSYQPPAIRKLAAQEQAARITADDAQKQEQALRDAFDLYDGEGSGSLPRSALPDVLAELGFPDVDDDGHAKFTDAAVPGGKVTFPQFAAVCNELVSYAAGPAVEATPRRHGPNGFLTPRRGCGTPRY